MFAHFKATFFNFFLLAALFSMASPALAQTSEPVLLEPGTGITWNPPTSFVDGAELDPTVDISNYTFQCGTTSGGPYDVVSSDVPPTSENGTYETTVQEVMNEQYGEFFCTMTATATNGNTSEPSNEVYVDYPNPSPPNPPTDLMIFKEDSN